MNIITSDDFCYREQLDCIIPVTICIPEDGSEPTIAAYPDFLDIVTQFCEKFQSDLLSEPALRWLDEKIFPMISRNYEREEEAIQEIFENYVAESLRDVNEEIILVNSIMNYEGDAQETGIELDLDDQPNCVTVENGKIVSYAGINDTFDDDDEGEISICVETDENYRGKGYAASNTAALIRWLIIEEKYQKIKYECSCRNYASVKTAQKAGMRLAGRTYYYVAYLRDGELEV